MLTEDDDGGRKGGEEGQQHGADISRSENLEQELSGLVDDLCSSEQHETVYEDEEERLETSDHRRFRRHCW